MVTEAAVQEVAQQTSQEAPFNPDAFMSGYLGADVIKTKAVQEEQQPPADAPPAAPAPAADSEQSQAADATAAQGAKYQLELDEAKAKRLMEVIGVQDESEFDFDKVVTTLTQFTERENVLRQQLLDKGVFDSEKLQQLDKEKAMTQEGLVKDRLVKMGMSEEDAQEQVDLYVANNVLEKHYNLHASKIDTEREAEVARIKAEYEAQIQEKVAQANGSMTTEQRQKFTDMFNEHLAPVSEIAGLSFGATPDESAKNKAEHVGYLVSGQFERDIKANPRDYAEMAFVFRNWDTVRKTLVSAGTETGKAMVLKRLTNPSNPGQGTAPLQNGSSDGFNAEAFMQGRLATMAPKQG